MAKLKRQFAVYAMTIDHWKLELPQVENELIQFIDSNYYSLVLFLFVYKYSEAFQKAYKRVGQGSFREACKKYHIKYKARMKFIPTAISDVILIEPNVFGDHRGFFMETWQRKTFAENGIDYDFVQDNHSKSSHGILRGLHYQTQHTQGKLVRVVDGSVFDVAVDMRKNSTTFGQWVGYELSAENLSLIHI